MPALIPEDKDFQYLVRIANTDLNGKKPILLALQKIKGVGFSFANMICACTGVDKTKKTGYLSKEEIEKIDTAVRNPYSLHVPTWLFNRRKDYETGEDKHLIMGELDFAKSNDIRLFQTIRCYKGFRHAAKLPVRGQRTRSNFRKNKGKVQGVKKKAIAAPEKAAGGKASAGKAGGKDAGKKDAKKK
ncbi:30S ribosomal protein S13 [Candidatus Woesearchaeota archaeon]|nr:30S ribosomal protein S13 [Candidatus Woesearchaeota archaeon]